MVVITPTPASVQPIARCCSCDNLLAFNSAIPAPNMPRVMAINAISGIVKVVVFILLSIQQGYGRGTRDGRMKGYPGRKLPRR